MISLVIENMLSVLERMRGEVWDRLDDNEKQVIANAYTGFETAIRSCVVAYNHDRIMKIYNKYLHNENILGEVTMRGQLFATLMNQDQLRTIVTALDVIASELECDEVKLAGETLHRLRKDIKILLEQIAAPGWEVELKLTRVKNEETRSNNE